MARAMAVCTRPGGGLRWELCIPALRQRARRASIEGNAPDSLPMQLGLYGDVGQRAAGIVAADF